MQFHKKSQVKKIEVEVSRAHDMIHVAAITMSTSEIALFYYLP